MDEQLTQKDLEAHLHQLITLLEAFRQEMLNLFKEVANNLEIHDKQLAFITLSLGEQAAAVDGLIATFIKGESEEEEFLTNLEAARKRLMDALSNNASNTTKSEEESPAPVESMDS